MDLRWYKHQEYRKLSEDEKTELIQWRKKSKQNEKSNASVADAKIAASIVTKVEESNNAVVAALKLFADAVVKAIPGAKISSVVAAEDEASPQPAGESEAAVTGQVSATNGSGNDDGEDDKKTPAVTFAELEADMDQQTRVAAAVGLNGICKSRKKQD